MYTPYITPEEYAEAGYNEIPVEDRNRYLTKASRHIDDLTFNRIVDKGFENLTEFQQDIIRTVTCEHATFLSENRDILGVGLNKYSINGVSMDFGSGEGITYEGGLPIERSIYAILKQTGLCCRLVG